MKTLAKNLIGGFTIVERDRGKAKTYPVFKREESCNKYGSKVHVRLHGKNGIVWCYDAQAPVEIDA